MLRKIMNFISGNLKNEKGQGMVEYALIIGLVSIAVIAVLLLLGPEISRLFQEVVDQLRGIPT